MSVQSHPIVVGTDFSEAAQTALDYAALLAARSQAELQVVYAWNPTGLPLDAISDDHLLSSLLDQARERVREKLNDLTEGIRSRGIQATAVFEQGPASRILPAVAERGQASLIVVGRHGHASLAHVFLGSVSERVVRTAPCPVLVVPKIQGELRLPRRLLVGVDFSDASREALYGAMRIARQLGCEDGLVLVHAYQDEREMWLASWSEIGLKAKIAPDDGALRRWATQELGKGIRVECAVVDGYAERALPRAMAQKECDWIVLGIQGRTALASHLIGSTTQRILKLSSRPVLAVPPQGAPMQEGVD